MTLIMEGKRGQDGARPKLFVGGMHAGADAERLDKNGVVLLVAAARVPKRVGHRRSWLGCQVVVGCSARLVHQLTSEGLQGLGVWSDCGRGRVATAMCYDTPAGGVRGPHALVHACISETSLCADIDALE